MNEKIKALEQRCWSHRVDGVLVDGHLHFDTKKFAELIVRECCIALNPMLRDMISRGQGRELILEHFGFNPKEITTAMLDTAIAQLEKQLAEKKNDI
jgi:hypothetical protein